MREYAIQLPSGMETTVLLPDDEAEKRGLKPVAAKAKTPPNKQANPENKTSGASKRAEAVSKSFGHKGDAGTDAG